MEIEYNITISDHEAFALSHAEDSPAISRTNKYTRLLIPAICILIPIVYTVRGYPILIDLYAGLLIFAFLWFIFFPRFLRMTTVWEFRWSFKEGSNENAIGKRHLIVSPESVKEIGDSITRMTKWPAVERIRVTKDHIFICDGAVRPYIIPKRAFSDDANIISFLDIVEQYQQQFLCKLTEKTEA